MTELIGAEGAESENRINWLGVGIFLAVTVVAPAALLLQMKSQGLILGDPSNGLPAWMTATLLLSAAVGALLARWLGKEGFADARLKWMSGKVFWQIYFLTMGLTLLAFVLSALFGWVQIDSEMAAYKEAVREMMESAMAARGTSLPPGMMATQVKFAVMSQYFAFVIGALFAMAVTLPSEWGWRGYLYPRLERAWGARNGAWAIALVVGLFSWFSLSMMGEISLMGHPPESALWGGMLGTVLLTYVACFVFSKTRSVWASGLLVGGAQAFIGLPVMYMANPTPWLAAPYGLAYILVLAAVVWKVNGMDWAPISEATPLLEMETAYDIPEGPSIPEPKAPSMPDEPEDIG